MPLELLHHECSTPLAISSWHLFAERLYDAEFEKINLTITQDLANVSASASTSSTNPNIRINERLLFHGTSHTDPMMILNHPDAFMKDYSSEGFYGKGLYFAELARYSNAPYNEDDDGNKHYFRYNIPNTTQYQMLVCSVICGSSSELQTLVNDGTRELSQKSLGTKYHSIHAGPHQPSCAGPGEDDSCMYVVYKDTQVAARYLITYESI